MTPFFRRRSPCFFSLPQCPSILANNGSASAPRYAVVSAHYYIHALVHLRIDPSVHPVHFLQTPLTRSIPPPLVSYPTPIPSPTWAPRAWHAHPGKGRHQGQWQVHSGAIPMVPLVVGVPSRTFVAGLHPQKGATGDHWGPLPRYICSTDIARPLHPPLGCHWDPSPVPPKELQMAKWQNVP